MILQAIQIQLFRNMAFFNFLKNTRRVKLTLGNTECQQAEEI